MGQDKEKFEIIGRTGKHKYIHKFDIDINPRVELNEVDGFFYPYITRWYRLPGKFKSEYEAMQVILDFQKRYLL